MSLLARLDSPSRASERRASRRRRLRLEAGGTAGPARGTEVVVHDLSEAGMLLESAAPLQIGERIDLVIPEAGPAEATIVWTSGHYFGCRFEQPLSTAAVSAALLRSPDPGEEPGGSRAVYAALVELRALARVIESITDQVDRAIDELTDRKTR